MEDVLDLYEEPYNPLYPTVCLDERSCQLLDHTRPPLPVEPGRPARVDYEYKRNGTCNLFAFFEPHRGWRHIKVTEQRTKLDVAECLRELVDEHYPGAKKIRVVLDNLNVHTLWTLYERYPAEQARRIASEIWSRVVYGGQAASSVCMMSLAFLTPSLKVTPPTTSVSSSDLFSRLHPLCADSASL